MNHDLDRLEQRLAEAYHEQARLYDQALRIMERRQGEPPNGDLWVHDLQAALTAVAAIDASSAADRSAWLKSGRSPGPALRDILGALAERIRLLAGHVDRSVADLSTRRQQMLPELDGFISQQRMLQAYDQYSRPFEKA